MKCTVYKINIKNVHMIDFNNAFFFGFTADKQLPKRGAEIYLFLKISSVSLHATYDFNLQK